MRIEDSDQENANCNLYFSLHPQTSILTPRCSLLNPQSSILNLNPRMSWLAVMLTVDAGSVEALSDALLEVGALSVDVTDADAGTSREHAMFGETDELDAPAWERSLIRALFDEHDDIATSVSAALRSASLHPASSYEVERIADRDWVRATQNQFQPVRVSPRLWVVPTWHTPPNPAAINLIIDPGLAFGTGTHATTRLCLQWLDAYVRGGESGTRLWLWVGHTRNRRHQTGRRTRDRCRYRPCGFTCGTPQCDAKSGCDAIRKRGSDYIRGSRHRDCQHSGASVNTAGPVARAGYAQWWAHRVVGHTRTAGG